MDLTGVIRRLRRGRAKGRIPDEQRLMNKILEDYNPASRPVYNASHEVVIYFGLTLTQIADMVSISLK